MDTTDVMDTVEIVDDTLVVLDRDGNGCEVHDLRSGLRAATRQVQRWTRTYVIPVADVYRRLIDYYAARR